MNIYKKFEVNRTKIKGGCQLYTKAAPQQSWSDLTLKYSAIFMEECSVNNDICVKNLWAEVTRRT